MTRREKLIERIRARPVEADFADVKALLEAFGWELRGAKGSHNIFVKHGGGTLVISTVGGRKVKRYQIEQICERLELD